PADYPADRGNNDDDESSNDDEDDDDVEKDERTRRRRNTKLRLTLLMYLQMILSPKAEDIEAFETDESASTPPTIFTTTI
nr:hypothetical protein [Tanacetum cinerariifolium]